MAVFVGDTGDNMLSGGAGADSILGLAGDDSLNGGLGADTIDGGLGADTVNGDGGADVIVVRAGELQGDAIDGGTGIDVFEARGGGVIDLSTAQSIQSVERLSFGDDADNATTTVRLTTETIENEFVPSNFQIVGQTGEVDRLEISVSNGSGIADLSSFVFANFGAEDLVSVLGDANGETIIATSVNDSVTGAAGADSIEGRAGADTLDGGSEDDTLLGGAGADVLIGGAGSDVIDGGDATDRVVYAFHRDEYIVSEFAGVITIRAREGTAAFAADERVDTITNVENFTFENGDYTSTTVLNDPPVARGDAVAATEDLAATYTFAQLLSNDTDGDNPISGGFPDGTSAGLTIAGVGAAVNGTVSIDAVNQTVTFTPSPDFAGQGSFTYTVSDGTAVSRPATVTVTVANVNDAPVLGPVASQTIADSAADDVYANLVGQLSATDVDTGDSRTFGLSGSSADAAMIGGVAYDRALTTSYGVLRLESATGKYVFVPNDAAIEGLKTSTFVDVTFTVTDGASASDSESFRIDINGANDAPGITVAPVPAVAEADASTVTTVTIADFVTISDRDVDDAATDYVSGSLAYSGVGSTGPGVSADQFTLDTSTGQITYDRAEFNYLAAGETVTAQFTFNAQSGSDVVPRTISLTITGSNDAPVLGFSQSFETDTAGITTGDGYGAIQVVPSGTNGIQAPDGGDYAIITEADGSGPFTRFGSSSAEFVDGLQTEVKVYINAEWGENEGFQYTVAANGSDGVHQRDFVFRVRSDGEGAIQVGSALGTTFDPITTDLDGVEVTESGWYTLQHTFRNDGGQLVVDLNLIGADGVPHLVATLAAGDPISEVGGQRYGWFTDISVPGGLAVDAYTLGDFEGEVTEVADGPGEATAIYATSGVIPFSDADLSDTHTVTFAPGAATGYRGTFAINAADSTDDGRGAVTWSYIADNGELDSLAEGETATQTYVITVDDGNGGTSSQTVTVTIVGTNDAPTVTAAVTATIDEDDASPATVDLLADASDIDGDDIDVASVAVSVTGGTWSPTVAYTVDAETGQLSLDPNQFTALGVNESVELTFGYNVVDGNGGSTPATAVVTVTGTNDAPVLTAVPSRSYMDTVNDDTFDSFSGQLTSQDADRTDSAVYGVAESTASAATIGDVTYDRAVTTNYGVLRLESSTGKYIFVPNDGAIEGLKTTTALDFSFTVSDGANASDSEVLTITLNGANDAPTLPAVGPSSLVDTSADDTFASISGSLNGTDRDTGENLTYELTTSTTSTLSGYDLMKVGDYGVMHLNSATGAYVYVPNDVAIEGLRAGQNPSEAFNFSVSDGSLSDSRSLVINLTGANDATVVVADSVTITDNDDPYHSATSVLANDSDLDLPGSLSVVGVKAGGPLGSFVSVGSNGGQISTFFGVLTIQANGDYSFAPNAFAQALNVGDTFELSFSYQAKDGAEAAVTSSLNITLNGANDAPVVGSIASNTYVENAAAIAVAPSIAIADVDDTNLESATVTLTNAQTGDVLSVAGVSGSTGVLTGGIAFTISGSSITFAGDASKADYAAALAKVTFASTSENPSAIDRSLSFTVNDGTDNSNVSVGTIQVTPVNDGPTANDDAAATGENQVLSFDVLANDTDLDSQGELAVTSATAIAVTGVPGLTPSSLDVTVVDNKISFKPNAQFDSLNEGDSGSVTISYQISDGAGGTSSAQLVLSVTGVDEIFIDPAGDGSGSIDGTAFGDQLYGRGGNDTLSGLGDDDDLFGGDGVDYLYGGAGGDALDGGAGFDYARYDDANYGDLRISLVAPSTNTGSATGDSYLGIEAIYAGLGNDTLIGDAGDNYLVGAAGNDMLFGGLGADALYGGVGLDYARYDDANGNMRISLATPNANTGAASGDSYFGIEAILAGMGDDTIYGDGGANTLQGAGGNDVLYGGEGADALYGGAGFDYVRYDDADYGNLLIAMKTPNVNTGAAAGDTYDSIEAIYAGAGDDRLVGNDANNYLYGKEGNDTLNGGLGSDTLGVGQGGQDVIRFTTTLSVTNVDTVLQFNVRDDTIELSSAIFTAFATTGSISPGAFNIGAAASEADDRIIYNAGTGALIYDSNGNVAGGATQFAVLSAGLALTANDFVVI